MRACHGAEGAEPTVAYGGVEMRLGRRIAAIAVCGLLAIQLAMADAAPAAAATLGKADRILVLKSARLLELFHGRQLLATFPIALGRHPVGAKHMQGDGRTPEGIYVIDGRTSDTPYHLALHISYPDGIDRFVARKAGVEPGGAIYIHGLPARFGYNNPKRFYYDWTEGCIAVSNVAIEAIWASVDNGTLIEIRP